MAEFTRNYRQLFREAKTTNNTFRMNELFESLCDEAEISDLERDQAGVAAAKEAAEIRNDRDRGKGGKII